MNKPEVFADISWRNPNAGVMDPSPEVYIGKNTAIIALKAYGQWGEAAASGLALGRTILQSLEPADVKPVKRGEWKCVSTAYPEWMTWNVWRCSECGYIRSEGWAHTINGKKPSACFCENCGADMRKEKAE